MKNAADMESLVCRDLARLAVAVLQLPDFLVLSEGPDGALRWLDASLVPVARHWQEAFRGEVLLPEAVDLASRIAVAMQRVVTSFLSMHAGAATTEQQRHWMGWEIRHQVVVDWLGQTDMQELNAATRAWQRWPGMPGQHADDAAVAWQAWELIHVAPELAKLRAALLRHMEHPRLPEYGQEKRICGMRPIGP